MTSTAMFVPTLPLRRLDPVQLIRDYEAGATATLHLPEEPIHVAKTVSPSVTGFAESYRDHNNSIITVHYSNHPKVVDTGCVELRCFWCMRDVPIGQHVPVCTGLTLQHVNNDLLYLFYAADVCCSFPCALAFATNYLRNEQAVVCTHQLYSILYPDSPPLKAAPDFRLLATYGGTMTWDEFRSCNPDLVEKQLNVAYIPVSNVYQQRR